MKKIIYSFAIIAVAAAVIIGGTQAFFSDEETSTGNTFAAGAIDLKVDSQQHYNGNECIEGKWVGNSPYPIQGTDCGGTWGQRDVTGAPIDGIDIVNEQFFNLTDLKPGDSGENTISLHVDNNDAWACAKITVTSDEDVTCVEPEKKAEGDGVCDVTAGLYKGDMRKNLSLAWWADDGDNILQQDELNTLFFLSGAKLSDLLAYGGPANNELNLTLADINTNFFLGLNNVGNTVPLDGGVTNYVAFAWCFGDMGINGTDITCNGGPAGNDVQTDSITVDMGFTVVQSRNNEGFECKDSYRKK